MMVNSWVPFIFSWVPGPLVLINLKFKFFKHKISRRSVCPYGKSQRIKYEMVSLNIQNMRLN